MEKNRSAGSLILQIALGLLFIVSGIAHQFEMGNPTYCAGKNGCEVAKEVIFSCTGEFSDAEDVMYLEKSSEYWIGWILAYYQWLRNIPFKNIFKVISMDDLVRMYPVYHEADVSMFVDTVDEKLLAYRKTNNQLKRLRMYAEYTQSKLSEESGVPIRQIQLFEQGQRDIRKAQTMTVLKLAKALHCKMEDLL